MPLADWIALQSHQALVGTDARMPWDVVDDPKADPAVVAAAEAYQREHTALRDA
jgi:hypothetical protein